MKCTVCGQDMTCNRGEYHYKECGLDNVYLVNIKICSCVSCKEKVICIPQMPVLHTAVAKILLEKTSRLNGNEIRFLRKNIGLKSVELSKYLGVNISSLSRWEHGEQKISLPHDLLLRVVYANIKGLPIEETKQMIENRFGQITPQTVAPSPVHLDINNFLDTCSPPA